MSNSTTSIGRRELMLGGVLAATSGIAGAFTPRASGDARVLLPDTALPDRIADYTALAPAGFVLPPSGALASRTYLQVLAKLYVAADAPPVMLLIARGRAEDPGMIVHRPERCYRASGFAISGERRFALPPPFPTGAHAFGLTAKRNDRIEQILFWTRIGSQYPSTGLEQRSANIRANLAGIVPAGVLLRLSVVAADGVETFAQLTRFHMALIATLAPAPRAALVGGA